jgi:hypothetical protein
LVIYQEGNLCFFMLTAVHEQNKRGTHVKGKKVIKNYILLQFL